MNDLPLSALQGSLPATLPLASRRRRLASLVYELFLLTALLLVATFPFVGLTGGEVTFATRYALQLYLLTVCGAYFLWFWRHGGQTLAMKTWRVRLLDVNGAPLCLRTALKRYCLALLGLASGGLGFWWALWDKDRQFLHDRLAKTRLFDTRP